MNYLKELKIISASSLLSGTITSTSNKCGIKDSKSLFTIGISSFLIISYLSFHKYNKKIN